MYTRVCTYIHIYLAAANPGWIQLLFFLASLTYCIVEFSDFVITSEAETEIFPRFPTRAAVRTTYIEHIHLESREPIVWGYFDSILAYFVVWKIVVLCWVAVGELNLTYHSRDIRQRMELHNSGNFV